MEQAQFFLARAELELLVSSLDEPKPDKMDPELFKLIDKNDLKFVGTPSKSEFISFASQLVNWLNEYISQK